MKRLGRNLRWGIALLVLALILMGAYAYFIGTRAMLSQAEAFAFRRMTVPQLAEQGTFRFFYATNRASGNAEGPIRERFASEREETLSFGAFDTDIEPSLGLGMILDASDWFLNEEIRLPPLFSFKVCCRRLIRCISFPGSGPGLAYFR